MAYTTINNSSLFMNPLLYAGNSDGAATQSITGVGFTPDLTLIKYRDGTQPNQFYDTIRGATKVLKSVGDILETTDAQGLTSFDSDGFSLGTNNTTVNQNGGNYVAWNWKAGTAVSGQTTGSGTYKTYTGSVNTTSGFSIIKYTGNGTAGHTIPHNLGVAPSMVICKSISENRGWPIQHSGLTSAAYSVYLSTTNAQSNSTNSWNSTAASSSVVTLGNDANNNSNDQTYIMYSFAEVPGYSNFGSYTGNGNVDGPFSYTGFRPAFVIIKRTDVAKNWYMNDNLRNGYNPSNPYLSPNLTATESGGAEIDILSNGFKLRADGTGHNQSGGTYIYMAIGQSLVGTNNIPNNAR